MMIKKLLCWLLGHKWTWYAGITDEFYDGSVGFGVIKICERCENMDKRVITKDEFLSYSKYASENQRLRDFVLWLTPCGDPSIPEDKHPTYETIGKAAKKALEGNDD